MSAAGFLDVQSDVQSDDSSDDSSDDEAGPHKGQASGGNHEGSGNEANAVEFQSSDSDSDEASSTPSSPLPDYGNRTRNRANSHQSNKRKSQSAPKDYNGSSSNDEGEAGKKAGQKRRKPKKKKVDSDLSDNDRDTEQQSLEGVPPEYNALYEKIRNIDSPKGPFDDAQGMDTRLDHVLESLEEFIVDWNDTEVNQSHLRRVISTSDIGGQLLLFAAVEAGKEELVNFLVEHNVDATATNKDKQTVVDLASFKELSEDLRTRLSKLCVSNEQSVDIVNACSSEITSVAGQLVTLVKAKALFEEAAGKLAWKLTNPNIIGHGLDLEVMKSSKHLFESVMDAVLKEAKEGINALLWVIRELCLCSKFFECFIIARGKKGKKALSRMENPQVHAFMISLTLKLYVLFLICTFLLYWLIPFLTFLLIFVNPCFQVMAYFDSSGVCG